MLDACHKARYTVAWQPQPNGKGIRRLEADSTNIALQQIRIAANDIDGLLPILAIDLGAERRRNSKLLEEEHHISDLTLLRPAIHDLLALAGADALDLFQTYRLQLYD